MPLTHKPVRDVIEELIKYLKKQAWQNKTMKEVSILYSSGCSIRIKIRLKSDKWCSGYYCVSTFAILMNTGCLSFYWCRLKT